MMHLKRKCWKALLASLGFIALAIVVQPSYAVVVTGGGGAVLFADDFAEPVMGTFSTPIIAVPEATVGTWDINPVSVSVLGYAGPEDADYPAPGASQGDNYLLIQRLPGDGLYTSTLNFDRATTSTDGTINLSMMRCFSDEYGAGTARLEFFKVLGDSGKQAVRMYAKEVDGQLGLFYHSGSYLDTGIRFDFNEWVDFDIDLNPGTSTYSVTVTDADSNVSSCPDLYYYEPVKAIDSFQIIPYADSTTAGTVGYIDDVSFTSSNGATFFADDFETPIGVITDPEVTHNEYEALTPEAVVGSWDVEVSGTAQSLTVDSTFAAPNAPGSYEGEDYYRIARFPSQWNSTSWINVQGIFERPATLAEDGTVSLSMMRCVTDEYGIGNAQVEFYKVLGENGDELVRMYSKEVGGELALFYDASTTERAIDTGVRFDFNEWVQFDLDLDLATQTFNVSVTDADSISSTAEGLSFFTASNVATMFQVIPSPDGAVSYFDAVTAVERPLPGDANGDGRVDGSDVTILAGNWQAGVGAPDPTTITWEMGDFNGDGQIDGSDVTILAGNWQAGVEATSATVPEPSVIFLVFGGFIALIGVCRRR